MPSPNINTGQKGFDLTYTEVWADEFETDGPGPGPNFDYDLLDDALNRTGNNGQDENGNPQGGSVPGKRWAAWTNGNNDSFVSRLNGELRVGGFIETAADPTRESYTHNGTFYDWSNRRLYAPYFGQWGRVYSNDVNGQITDPNKVNITYGPGHYIELRVNFEQMKTRGFRLSAWLMPVIPNESLAYDINPANGAEIDIFEFENWSHNGFNAYDVIQQKVIAGSAGTTSAEASETPTGLPASGGNVDCSAFGMNNGYHTIGVLWQEDAIDWHIDGVHTLTESVRVPLVQQALYITREINSGVKDNPSNSNEIPSNGIKRPADVGLYAVSALDDEANINTDVGLIDYVRVWAVGGGSNTGGGGINATPSEPYIVTLAETADRNGSMTMALPDQADGSPANPDHYTHSWSAGPGAAITGGANERTVYYTKTDIPDNVEKEDVTLVNNWEYIG